MNIASLFWKKSLEFCCEFFLFVINYKKSKEKDYGN